MKHDDKGDIVTAELEAKIYALEAREQIRDLVVRYGMAVDDRDIDLVGELFTQAAVFRHGDDSIVNHGRDEIVAFYTDRLTSFGPSYHYPHSHLVTLDAGTPPTTATGVVNAHAELAVDDRTYITALRYTDQYALDDGAWRFAERRIAMLYYMDMADLADGGLSVAKRKRYFGTVEQAELPEKLPTWQAFFAAAEGS